MTRDTKIVGSVYAIITTGAEKYFTRAPLLTKYNAFNRYLVEKGNEAYKADNDFPIDFYESMCDVILRWCFNAFEGITKENITAFYKQVWRIHRKFLLSEAKQEDVYDSALEAFDDLLKTQISEMKNMAAGEETISKYLKAIHIYVLRHIEAVFSEEQPGDTEWVDESGQ